MVRYEKTPNHGATTLDGSITAGDTSVTVIDGSVFPSEGDFRLLCQSELMLCTARSSNVLTVERGIEGTTAASHANTVAIKTVATAGQWDRLAIDLGVGCRYDEAFSQVLGIQRPRLLLDENNNILTASSFTQVNFGGSTTLTDTGYGGLRFFDAAGGGATHANRLAVIAAPATPWRVVMRYFMGYGVTYDSWDWFGLLCRESSTGEFIGMRNNPWQDMRIQHYNSPASLNTTLNDDLLPSSAYGWVQIYDDGTNLFFGRSTNGRNWYFQYNESRTARLASGADQVGMYMNAQVASGNDHAHYITSFIIESV